LSKILTTERLTEHHPGALQELQERWFHMRYGDVFYWELTGRTFAKVGKGWRELEMIQRQE